MAEDVQEKRDISADKAPLKKKSWENLKQYIVGFFLAIF